MDSMTINQADSMIKELRLISAAFRELNEIMRGVGEAMAALVLTTDEMRGTADEADG